MITIYHLLRSRSERVIWLLEELQEPYDLIAYVREPNGEAPAAYRALHPMGTSPIARDGDLTLVETGGIVDYVLARYGKGRLVPKPGTREHDMYLQWMHFAEGSAAFSILCESMLTAAAKPAEARNRVKALAKLWRDRNDRMLPYLDGELARWRYFAGDDFTAADVMMGFPLSIYERFTGRKIEGFPNLERYCADIFARPAYVKAMDLAEREPA